MVGRHLKGKGLGHAVIILTMHDLELKRLNSTLPTSEAQLQLAQLQSQVKARFSIIHFMIIY